MQSLILFFLLSSFFLAAQPYQISVSDLNPVPVPGGTWIVVEATFSDWHTVADYDGEPNDKAPDKVFSNWLIDYTLEQTSYVSAISKPNAYFRRQSYDRANKTLEEQTRAVTWRFVPDAKKGVNLEQ